MSARTAPAGVLLGYHVGSGAELVIPVQHMVVTGQTQQSGKTTTLEALVQRSGLSAIAFVTKREEAGFRAGHAAKPYFRDRADWQFVSSVLEATLRERLKFERSWIMRACKGARSLADVRANVREAMLTAKGMSADVYLTLDHYLDIVIPQIEELPYTDTLELKRGLNVMDLQPYTTELQALVIRSVLEWVYERGRNTLVIIPEAWEFIPQNRGSPVLLACETLIRKGGNLENFVWLDSQDIAGVHKNILRSAGVWIIGVQREANEVKRALAHIPGGIRKPSVDDIMGLERGHFFACFGRTVAKVYVQPAWMDRGQAIAIAKGAAAVDAAAPPPAQRKKEDEVDRKEADALRAENAALKRQVDDLTAKLAEANAQAGQITVRMQKAEAAAAGAPGAPLDMDAIYAEVKRRAAGDPGILALLREKPELKVTVERRIIEANDGTLYGRLACLLADGFFDDIKTGNAAFVEIKRRGGATAKPNVYRECDKLAQQGFLTKEADGYKAVEGMKVNIVERRAA